MADMNWTVMTGASGGTVPSSLLPPGIGADQTWASHTTPQHPYISSSPKTYWVHRQGSYCFRDASWVLMMTWACLYKACSKKKDRTSSINTLLFIWEHLSTVPFKVVPSTGDTPFPALLLLLECFLERIFCDGAQFCYRIFLNLLYGLETTYFHSDYQWF